MADLILTLLDGKLTHTLLLFPYFYREKWLLFIIYFLLYGKCLRRRYTVCYEVLHS